MRRRAARSSRKSRPSRPLSTRRPASRSTLRGSSWSSAARASASSGATAARPRMARRRGSTAMRRYSVGPMSTTPGYPPSGGCLPVAASRLRPAGRPAQGCRPLPRLLCPARRPSNDLTRLIEPLLSRPVKLTWLIVLVENPLRKAEE